MRCAPGTVTINDRSRFSNFRGVVTASALRGRARGTRSGGVGLRGRSGVPGWRGGVLLFGVFQGVLSGWVRLILGKTVREALQQWPWTPAIHPRTLNIVRRSVMLQGHWRDGISVRNLTFETPRSSKFPRQTVASLDRADVPTDGAIIV